jgi:hypothetical protein
VIKNLKAINYQVSQLARQMGKVVANSDDTNSSTYSGSVSNDKERKKDQQTARIHP